MSHQRRVGGPYVVPLKQADATNPPLAGRGQYTLAANTTYLYPVGSIETPGQSFHVQWDAGAILAIAVESGDFEKTDVPLTSIALGDWMREDNANIIIGIKNTDGSIGGAAVANSVISVAGGTAGGARINLINNTASKLRLRVDVGVTGGVVRVGHNQKG